MARQPCCDHAEKRGAVDPQPGPGVPPEVPEDSPSESESREAALAAMAQRWPFGPVFFLGQLGAFVREKCPDPGEGLPVVEIHLAEGEILDLCHVMGVAPSWVALAVNELEAQDDAPPMRTELVPYSRIVQVTVRSCRSGKPGMGFTDERARQMFDGATCSASPENALRAAAAPRP